MRLNKLIFGDVLWGSREYKGIDYGIGYNDIPFIVISSDEYSAYLVEGHKKESSDSIKINVEYKDYYFDFSSIELVNSEFIYRFEKSLDENQKQKALETMSNKYTEGKISYANFDLKGFLEENGVTVVEPSKEEQEPTTYYVDSYETESFNQSTNPLKNYNLNAGKSRTRKNNIKK